jgi:hypothetical protein
MTTSLKPVHHVTDAEGVGRAQPERKQPQLVPEPDAAADEPTAPRVAAPLIDSRVAKYGGTRKDSKSTYDFPGMVDAASWRRTEVHRHTAWYGCALCGQKFSGPHAVYTHLAKVHDR